MAISDWFLDWFSRKEKPCLTCEALRDALYHERALNRELLSKLFPNQQQQSTEIVKPEAVPPKLIPWAVRRAQLEKAARVKAEELEVQKLENEMKLDIPSDATGTINTP